MDRGSKSRGLFLHASSVNVSGKALLFMGHSSSGKSTISRLLSERYPVIADDKVYIEKGKNGRWWVSGGYDGFPLLKGQARSAGHESRYPLGSVLRIFKSKSIEIAPLSPKETCRYLIDAVFEIDPQKEENKIAIQKSWFAMTAEISRNIVGWSLTFKKDKSIIAYIKEAFEE